MFAWDPLAGWIGMGTYPPRFKILAPRVRDLRALGSREGAT